MQEFTASLHLKCEKDTAKLAHCFAQALVVGDTVFLAGDLGVGKSSFARSFIRSLIGAEAEVPSPTFTLVQTYDAQDFEIWHCDLYRLSDESEVHELGLDQAFDDAVCLIEWPDRLGTLAPQHPILIELFHHEEGRDVAIRGQNPRILNALKLYG